MASDLGYLDTGLDDEILEEKRKAEAKIAAILEEFEKTTGARCEHIETNHERKTVINGKVHESLSEVKMSVWETI